jgi:hypothetical protein
MITNQKIEVGEVSYSRLSETLRFKVAANIQAIQTLEDICGRKDMTMEDVADEMGKLLERAILNHYSRGGMRLKYD